MKCTGAKVTSNRRGQIVPVHLSIKILLGLIFQSYSRIHSCFLQAESHWLQKDNQMVCFVPLILVQYDIPILYYGVNCPDMAKEIHNGVCSENSQIY